MMLSDFCTVIDGPHDICEDGSNEAHLMALHV